MAGKIGHRTASSRQQPGPAAAPAHTLIKDVDGLYDSDPKVDSAAKFIPEITVSELKRRKLQTLPFDRVLIDLLTNARQMKQFQIVNGLRPELLVRALRGEHVGTIVKKD